MLTADARQTVSTLIAAKRDMPGALIPVLHDIQDTLGYIPKECVADIAQAMNLSRAEVHGVISFYHHFRSEPAGSTVLQICRAEACQAMGSQHLWEHACSQLGIAAGHGADTTADGAVTLRPVYCLGLCSSSPAIMVNNRLHARVSNDQFDSLVAAARSGA